MKRKNPDLSFLEIKLIKKIIEVRKTFGLSQEDVAKQAGVSRGFIAQFETFRQKPSKDIIKKISRGLNYIGIIDEYEKINQDKLQISNYLSVIPILEYICTNSSNLQQHSGLFVVPEKISQFTDTIPGIYVYEIKDDSLSPDINKDDILIIKYFDDLKINDLPNLLLTGILFDGKDVIIRNIKKRDNSYHKKQIIYAFSNNIEKIPPFIINPNAKNNKWKIKGLVLAIISQKIMPGIKEIYTNLV